MEKWAGVPRLFRDQLLEENSVGVATGMVWTPFGGDILFIEVKLFPGKGSLILTGSLGDVMKESASAALSFLKANASHLKLASDQFEKNDIHIHMPEGGIPKDGPSAGITLTTALISAFTGVAVNREIAMTGEITLRGKVLPVGGIKEKVLAALPRRHPQDHPAREKSQGFDRSPRRPPAGGGFHLRERHQGRGEHGPGQENI